MTIENHIFDFLASAISSAPAGDTLDGIELHDTVYQTIKGDRGLRIGGCASQLAPTAGGNAVEEFNAVLTLVCYARVTGPDKTHRRTAREQAFELAASVSRLLIADPSLTSRVRDCRVMSVTKGYDNIGAEPFAISNLELVINESGQQL